MSDINLVRPFSVSIAEAKARVQKTVDELDAEYHLKSEWHGDELQFARSGLHGAVHLTDSEIRLHVDLSLLLKPLKAQLIRRIEDKFDRLFPSAKAEPTARHKRPRRPAR